jgi:hypothetical protein
VQFDLGDIPRLDSVLGPAFQALQQRQPGSVCLVNNAATGDAIGTLG